MNWKAILWISFLLRTVYLVGQDQPETDAVIDTIYTSVDLFEEQAPMKITLTLNLKEFQRTKYKGEYIPASFTYQINDTLRLEKNMRIKARGNFRKNYCQFAPYWLNIKKADVESIHLQDTKKFKIVTQCNDSKTYADYLLREYLAYRIYNILSDISFRVRLIDMTYVDTGRKGKITKNWAFMIEPEEMLAERLHALVIKKDELRMSMMEPEAFDLMALFMFMIGNSDYSIGGRHNVKLLGMEGFGAKGYTPVPYDFDYAGLVNASYAIPGEKLGITSVRERYFLGPCREDEEYAQVIAEINNHRDEILALIQSFEYLDEKNKKDVIGYLEEYFNMAETPYFIGTSLKSTCR
jgi:hypothetical protein